MRMRRRIPRRASPGWRLPYVTGTARSVPPPALATRRPACDGPPGPPPGDPVVRPGPPPGRASRRRVPSLPPTCLVDPGWDRHPPALRKNVRRTWGMTDESQPVLGSAVGRGRGADRRTGAVGVDRLGPAVGHG